VDGRTFRPRNSTNQSAPTTVCLADQSQTASDKRLLDIAVNAAAEIFKSPPGGVGRRRVEAADSVEEPVLREETADALKASTQLVSGWAEGDKVSSPPPP